MSACLDYAGLFFSRVGGAAGMIADSLRALSDDHWLKVLGFGELGIFPT